MDGVRGGCGAGVVARGGVDAAAHVVDADRMEVEPDVRLAAREQGGSSS